MTEAERIRELEKHLAEAERSAGEYKAVFDNCQVGILVLDGDRVIRRANRRVAEIYGYDSPEEMIGWSADYGHASRKASEEFGRRYFDSLRETKNRHVRLRAKRKDGSFVWCRVSGTAIDRNNPKDLSLGVVWIVDDITDLVETQEHLEHLARYDSLTEMAQRSFFYEQSERMIDEACRYETPLSLLMIDLDHFKKVNDTYGHQVGDQVLSEFCRRIRDRIRGSDFAGRLGGEEFAVLLPDTGQKEASALAERLRLATEKNPVKTDKAVIPLTVSIGVGGLDQTIPDISTLISRADKALYRAKDAGRNCVRNFDRQAPKTRESGGSQGLTNARGEIGTM